MVRALLQLVRWKNLLIIFLMQALLWLCVIRPAVANMPHLLETQNFLSICASTLCIAAAGYIINDYFDIRIDAINRPKKIILEKHLHRRLAIIFHTVLNVLGLLLALYVAKQVRRYDWLLLQLACTLLLWLYSTHYKRQFITGNIVVAFMTALSVFVLWLYEPALDKFGLRLAYTPQQPNPIFIIMAYTFFAFMLTWVREVTKDMEDHIGDEADGCRTMPIVWGLKRTVRFTQLLTTITLLVIAVAAAALFYKADYILAVYVSAALVVPLIGWTSGVSKYYTIAHYNIYSKRLKWIMVAGIVALPVNYLAHYAC